MYLIGPRAIGSLIFITFGVSLPLVILSRVLVSDLDGRGGMLGLLAALLGQRAVLDEYFPMGRFLALIGDWVLINTVVMLVIFFRARRQRSTGHGARNRRPAGPV